MSQESAHMWELLDPSLALRRLSRIGLWAQGWLTTGLPKRRESRLRACHTRKGRELEYFLASICLGLKD